MTDDIFSQTTDYKSIVLHAYSLRQCLMRLSEDELSIVSRISSVPIETIVDLSLKLQCLSKANFHKLV